MTPAELGPLLIQYAATYRSCSDGCPFEEPCKVARLEGVRTDPCTDFRRLLGLINEAKKGSDGE